jgi:hypothetical protein
MKLINPAHLHYLVPAALLVATAALGGSALVEPATACAAPKEWDIEAYDLCMKQATWLREGWDREYYCCTWSGGIWVPDKWGGGGKCTAPPADAEAQPTLPGVAPRPGEATQNPAPPPPPFRNPGVAPTVTLAPASPG